MSARLVVNNFLASTSNNSATSQPFRVTRATTDAALTVQVTLSGARSGNNNLTVTLESVLNPGSTTLITVPMAPAYIDPIVVDADQAQASFIRNFDFPTAPGVFRVSLAFAGTGTNTFSTSVYVAP